METVYFQTIPLTRLVLGTSVTRLCEDQKTAFAVLDMAYEAGFRTFDTAHIYGNAERNLGAWMKSRKVRDEITVLTKGCNPGMGDKKDGMTRKILFSQVGQSLKRLKTDHIELYLLHRDDESKPVGEIVEALNELKAKGVVGAFGGSNWKLERLVEANEYAREHNMEGFTVASPCYSLALFERDLWGGSVSVSGEENKAYRAYLASSRMPVFTYSSLARGYLSGRYRCSNLEERLSDLPVREYDSARNRERLLRLETMAREKGVSMPSLAIAWLLRDEMNVFPILSPTRREHLNDCVCALELKLTEEERAYLG